MSRSAVVHGTLLAAVVAAGALCVAAPEARASAERRAETPPPRALIAFLPSEPAPRLPLLFDLAERGMAVGLTSPTLGGYARRQMVLDVSQGSRISSRVYTRPLGGLDLVPVPEPPGGRIADWRAAVDRATDAPGEAVPGLLASAVERAGLGVAYAGVVGFEQVEAIAAADRAGRVERVSLGTGGTLADRALDLWREHALVVARLPEDAAGLAALDRLLEARGARDLVYVVRAPPAGRLRMLPAGIAGPGAFNGGGALWSASTRRAGLVTAIDVAPTVLEHLGLDVPDEMHGRAIEARPGRSAGELLAMSDRLNVVQGRRGPVLQWALLMWVILLAALERARGRAGVRAGLRIAFLAVIWLPGLALATAAFEPPAAVETLALAGGSLVLGALTDRLVRWPLAPALPAAAVLCAYAIDLASGSPLIVASLAGPNPRAGARFFGVGNELETILSLVALFGAGAALTLAPRRAAAGFAIVAVAVAAVLGAGRLGAAVGAVITLGAGGAAAVLVALPRRPRPLAVAAIVAAPAVAIGGLVAIDLATAAGTHLTSSVVEEPGDVAQTVYRRFLISVRGLETGTAPFSVGTALALLALGTAYRRRLLAPLGEWDPVRARPLRAAFAGALVATVAGALANDSGPVMILIGTAGLLAATAYVRGRPEVT